MNMYIAIERRIEIGKLIDSLICVIDDEISDNISFDDEKKYACQRLLEKLHSQYEIEQDEETMTIKQVHTFENAELSFGIHKGEKIKDVDFEYLCYLIDPSEFTKKLKKYVEYCNKHRYRD